MGWIYFQESVESELPLNPGSEQSLIASVTDTHRVYFCPECNQATLIKHPSGMMSPHSEQICCQESTSSVEAFPARISALLDLEKAWTESEVVFSSRSLDSSESAIQLSFSSKTSLPSEPVEGKEWLKNWPRSGMTVGGQLYLPPQLEPLTNAKGGSYLPTQRTSDGTGGAMSIERMKKTDPGKLQLREYARHNLWPTPRASEYKDCGPVGSKSQVHMEKRDYLCAKVKEESKPTGQLNPMWVEWLMGYPIGHTELNASVIAWFRPKLGKRSRRSQE